VRAGIAEQAERLGAYRQLALTGVEGLGGGA
jgi:hypothetical protein